MRADVINPIVLAYIGDSVLEVLVREYLVVHVGIRKPKILQKQAVRFVSAIGQRNFIEQALKEHWLSEQEEDIYRRGRNTKTGKNETVAHSYSTGFEAIIGHLYLEDKRGRIQEIFELYKSYMEQTNSINNTEK